MKASEINRAISEICGWHGFERSGILLPEPPWLGYPPKHLVIGKKHHVLDYCVDLNAMREAEKCLCSSERWVKFCVCLNAIVCDASDEVRNLDAETLWEMIHATAAQRAEAFLRTFGKWVEEEAIETADPNCSGTPR